MKRALILFFAGSWLAACGGSDQPAQPDHWSPSEFAPHRTDTLLVLALDGLVLPAPATSPVNLRAAIGELEAPHLARVLDHALWTPRAYTTSLSLNRALASLLCGVDEPTGPVAVKLLGRHELGVSEVSLAETLSEAGHRTFAALSASQFDAELSGLDRGFDTWLSPPLASGAVARSAQETVDACLPELEEALHESGALFALVQLGALEPGASQALGSGLSRAAMNIIRAELELLASREEPLAASLASWDESPSIALAEIEGAYMRQRGSPVRAVLDRARFRSQVRRVDAQVERLLEALERAGRRERAIVCVVGLRGPEATTLGQPASADDSGWDRTRVRVPWFLHVPTLEGAREIGGAFASVADVATTLAFLQGLAPAPSWTGRDALATLPTERELAIYFPSHEGLLRIDTRGEWECPPGVEPRGFAAEDLTPVPEGVRLGWVEALRADPGPVLQAFPEFVGQTPVEWSWAVMSGPLRGSLLGMIGARLLPLEERYSQGASGKLEVRSKGAGPGETGLLGLMLNERPLGVLPLPRLLPTAGPQWESTDGEPVLSIEPDGQYLKVRVVADPEQEVWLRVAPYPSTALVDGLKVEAPAGVTVLPYPLLPGAVDVTGVGPLTVNIRRRARQRLAWFAAVGGESVGPDEIRFDGRHVPVGDELELLFSSTMNFDRDPSVPVVRGTEDPERAKLVFRLLESLADDQ